MRSYFLLQRYEISLIFLFIVNSIFVFLAYSTV